jgi:hypothetical protein
MHDTSSRTTDHGTMFYINSMRGPYTYAFVPYGLEPQHSSCLLDSIAHVLLRPTAIAVAVKSAPRNTSVTFDGS